ncbi:MAG: restriction endonuclease subunit S [Acidobacteria bacterium]|nr:restriction endonuclease subunit S [Acidobacteriota bacterium]
MKLSDIATIRSGYLFRGKIEANAQGKYRVIQIGDLSISDELSIASLTRIDLHGIKKSQLLVKGDVLFISRGRRKQALAITEELEYAIASSQFFVLHPDERALPEYLAWFINQYPAQRYLEKHSTGSNVSLINIRALAGMPVRVPPLEVQRGILEVHRLSLRENELIEQIRNKRRSMIETALLDLIAK